jgi:hypothetical protein
MSVPEPSKSAVFENYTFGIEVAGQTDSDMAHDGKQRTPP